MATDNRNDETLILNQTPQGTSTGTPPTNSAPDKDKKSGAAIAGAAFAGAALGGGTAYAMSQDENETPSQPDSGGSHEENKPTNQTGDPQPEPPVPVPGSGPEPGPVAGPEPEPESVPSPPLPEPEPIMPGGETIEGLTPPTSVVEPNGMAGQGPGPIDINDNPSPIDDNPSPMNPVQTQPEPAPDEDDSGNGPSPVLGGMLGGVITGVLGEVVERIVERNKPDTPDQPEPTNTPPIIGEVITDQPTNTPPATGEVPPEQPAPTGETPTTPVGETPIPPVDEAEPTLPGEAPTGEPTPPVGEVVPEQPAESILTGEVVTEPPISEVPAVDAGVTPVDDDVIEGELIEEPVMESEPDSTPEAAYDDMSTEHAPASDDDYPDQSFQ